MEEETTTLSPELQKMFNSGSLSSADIAGLTGRSMQLNPYMAGISVLSTIPSIYQAIEQDKEIKRLKKQGIKDITPEAFKQYQALVEQQAVSSRLPGESIARDEITRQQAMALSNIQRGTQNPAQALRAAMALNQQGISARNQLTMAGARDQARRRAIANEAMMRQAAYQEQSRQEYARALGALEAAKMQNINKAVQGGLSGLANSFVIGSPKKQKTPVVNNDTTTTTDSDSTYTEDTTTNTTPYAAYGNIYGYKDKPYTFGFED